MPAFSYEAFDQTGRKVRGVVEAEDADAAEGAIGAQGLIPVSVREAASAFSGSGFRRLRQLMSPVPTQDLILFTRQFSTMTRAGLGALDILRILESQTESRRIREAVVEMSKDIQGGLTLSKAFARHKDVFPDLYTTMIQAGEVSGSLPEVLDRLTYIIRHEHKVRSDVRAALRYPAFVLGFLAFGFIVLQLFVVPRFAALFQNAGLTLPLPTRICIGIYEVLSRYGLLILALLVAVGVALGLWLRTPAGRYARDCLILKIPLVGPLILRAIMARFASILAILQTTGVPVVDALAILSATLGNRFIGRQLELAQDQLREGRGIANALRSTKCFTPMVVNMVAVGEESGNLETMMREVAQNYDMEVEYGTQKLSDSIGPILTVGLAALVGFFALAIYMPMWELGKMVR